MHQAGLIIKFDDQNARSELQPKLRQMLGKFLPGYDGLKALGGFAIHEADATACQVTYLSLQAIATSWSVEQADGDYSLFHGGAIVFRWSAFFVTQTVFTMPPTATKRGCEQNSKTGNQQLTE